MTAGALPLDGRAATLTFNLTLRRFFRTMERACARYGDRRSAAKLALPALLAPPGCPAPRDRLTRHNCLVRQIEPAQLSHTLGAGVGGEVDLLQLAPVQVRVNLRGRDIGMPQDLLQHAQVGAAGEQVRRE